MLLADGFERAFIGTTVGQPGREDDLAVYSYNKCIEVLLTQDDAMSYDEAVEFFYYNVAGAYVGEETPIFIYMHEER